MQAKSEIRNCESSCPCQLCPFRDGCDEDCCFGATEEERNE